MCSNFTIVINTCDKYSDLWYAHCFLMNKFWTSRNAKTILLTDKQTDFSFNGVEVMCVGKEADIIERLRLFVNNTKEEYILLTLDDYLINNFVNNDEILWIIKEMQKENLDYVRLFNYPKSKCTSINKKHKLFLLKYKKRYDVNLYPGIWKKDFLKKTLENINLDPWKYEVLLTKTAIKNAARCAWCKKKIFPFIDTVRKGMLLHRAKRFLKTNNLYFGNRKTISFSTEIKLSIMRFSNTYLPDFVRKFLKRIGLKYGMKFYSED